MKKVFVVIVLAVAVLFYLMPMYVLVISGLKEATNVSISKMWSLPETATTGGFREAWDQLGPNMSQSFLLVIPATVISSMLGAIN